MQLNDVSDEIWYELKSFCLCVNGVEFDDSCVDPYAVARVADPSVTVIKFGVQAHCLNVTRCWRSNAASGTD